MIIPVNFCFAIVSYNLKHNQVLKTCPYPDYTCSLKAYSRCYNGQKMVQNTTNVSLFAYL